MAVFNERLNISVKLGANKEGNYRIRAQIIWKGRMNREDDL